MYTFIYNECEKNQMDFHIVRGYHEEDHFIHTHDFAEFTIITDGEATHIAGGYEYPLKRGEVYVIPPNVWHGLKDVKKTIHQYHFKFNMASLTMFDDELKNISGFFSMFLPSKNGNFGNRLCLGEEDLQTVTNMCEMMLKEYEEKKSGYVLALKSMLVALICVVLRSYPEELTGDMDDYKKILPAIKYIEKHFNEKIKVEILAGECYLSSRQFSRLFVKVFNKSPADFLVHFRITNAYLKLLTTKESVAKIAHKCGFYDESHLSKMFLKYYGFLPNDVRDKA
jgi:AraC-like DNA-binding protein